MHPIETVNSIIENLRSAGHDDSNIKARDTYKSLLEKNASQFIGANKVIRVSAPSVGKEELIDRAINKMRPFNDHGSGFKDTLIYLSIVEDALNKTTETDRYILCTNDSKEFTQEIIDEFKSVTGKELYIVPSIAKVSEKLDELIPLNLYLAERNEKIKNIILKHLGDIMIAINEIVIERDGWAGSLAYESLYKATSLDLYSSLYPERTKEDIVGYNFDQIRFLNFNEVDRDKYKVSINVKTLIKYKDKKGSSNDASPYNNLLHLDSYSTAYSAGRLSTQERIKPFNIEIYCDLINENISVLSVLDSLDYP